MEKHQLITKIAEMRAKPVQQLKLALTEIIFWIPFGVIPEASGPYQICKITTNGRHENRRRHVDTVHRYFERLRKFYVWSTEMFSYSLL